MSRISVAFLYSLIVQVLITACLVAVPNTSFARSEGCTTSDLPTVRTLNLRPNYNALSIGDVIPTSTENINLTIECHEGSFKTSDTAQCNTRNTWSTGGSQLNLVSGMPNTYQIPGTTALGVQYLSENGGFLPRYTTAVDGFQRIDLQTVPDPIGTNNVNFVMRLVKISNDAPPESVSVPVIISCVAQSWANGPYNSGGSPGQSKVTYAPNVSVVTNVCSLDSSKEITLPTVPVSRFTGVGTTTGNLAFNLDFTCDGGADAFVYFSDLTDSLNSTDTLLANDTSTTTGVGIQLLEMETGSPIVYSKQVRDSQDTNVSEINTKVTLDATGIPDGGTGGISIPLQARYIQVEDTVTPGSIQAVAEVTIGYN